jgi:ketosteroid isomerase-like protein
MSEKNVELVREIYRAWAEGRSARDLIAANLEYVNPPYAVESGLRRDRSALARVRDVYPDFRVEPERFLDAGDDVVVIGTAHGTGASGVEAQWLQGYVWTIEDGRAIRFRWFNDPAEALEAAGLGGGGTGTGRD